MKKLLFALTLSLSLLTAPCVIAQDDWNDNAAVATKSAKDNWSDNAVTKSSANDDWNDNAVSTTSANDDWNDNAVSTTSANDDWNDNAVSTTSANDDWNDNAAPSTTSNGVRSTSSGSGGGWIWLLIIAAPIIWLIMRKKKKNKAAADKPQEAENAEEPEKIEENNLAADINNLKKDEDPMLDKILNNEALSGIASAFGLGKDGKSASSKQYYVHVGGQEHGPYTLQQMLDFKQQGRMNPQTQVRTSDSSRWSNASAFSELGMGASQNYSGVSDQFNVRVNGQVHGPYNLQQMQGFIQQGRMNRETQVMIIGKSSWMPARMDNRLADMLTKAGY